MRPRSTHEAPAEKQALRRKAVRLEAWTLVWMATVIAAVGLTMGSSQAMKAIWAEDLLSLVPAAAFLIAQRFDRRPPDERFPYGYHRAMGISFLLASTALLGFGLFILADSVMALASGERPSIGSRDIFGREVWAGWLMVAALVYSVVPPIVLGRLKLPIARELHDKTLHADAAMNRADWLTGLAGVLGIVGIACGLWWADAAAAAVISLEVARDGWAHLREVISDLMDRYPHTVDGKRRDATPERARSLLAALPWVREAEVRMREEGRLLVGEAFVVARDTRGLPRKLQEAGEALRRLDWRVHEVVVTAAPSLEGWGAGDAGDRGDDEAGSAPPSTP